MRANRLPSSVAAFLLLGLVLGYEIATGGLGLNDQTRARLTEAWIIGLLMAPGITPMWASGWLRTINVLRRAAWISFTWILARAWIAAHHGEYLEPFLTATMLAVTVSMLVWVLRALRHRLGMTSKSRRSKSRTGRTRTKSRRWSWATLGGVAAGASAAAASNLLDDGPDHSASDDHHSHTGFVPSDHDEFLINPASGLPMIGGIGGVDAEGNAYGTDGHHSDSSDWGSFSDTDSFDDIPFDNHGACSGLTDSFDSSSCDFDDTFSSDFGSDDW